MSADDAYGVVQVIIGVLPCGEIAVRGALYDAVLRWPEVDWKSVAERLREEDVGKIASWLDAEVDREVARQRYLRGGGS